VYNMIRKVANAMPKTHEFWIFFMRMPNFRTVEECIQLVRNGIYLSYKDPKKMKFLILTDFAASMEKILMLPFDP